MQLTYQRSLRLFTKNVGPTCLSVNASTLWERDDMSEAAQVRKNTNVWVRSFHKNRLHLK
jgi:hypothetical protein